MKRKGHKNMVKEFMRSKRDEDMRKMNTLALTSSEFSDVLL